MKPIHPVALSPAEISRNTAADRRGSTPFPLIETFPDDPPGAGAPFSGSAGFRGDGARGAEYGSERGQDSGAPPAELTPTLREQALAELKTILLAIQAGETDPERLTDLVFYARHPEMIETPLTPTERGLAGEWNTISEYLVQPALDEIVQAGFSFAPAHGSPGFPAGDFPASGAGDQVRETGAQSGAQLQRIIAQAVSWCPGLSPSILEGLLERESGFRTGVVNEYGYAGIAQLGRAEAREAGLRVGVTGSPADERLQPEKAIPAAARLLHMKSQRLHALAFSRYGHPVGSEFWKFTLAAYNGGEGTVALAMGNAWRDGLATARARGLTGEEATGFARRYCTKWDNLKSGGLDSALGRATAIYFPELRATKFHEIGEYPTAIVHQAAGE